MTSRAFRFERRWLGYLGVAVVFAIACVFLSRWQFARQDQAEHDIAMVNANYGQSPVPLESLIHATSASVEQNAWRPVTVEGTYSSWHSLARNRVVNSQAGFDLINIFVSNSGQSVVIDRGWWPATSKGTVVPGAPEPHLGPTVIVGRLMQSEPLLQGQSPTATTVASINAKQILKRSHMRGYSEIYLSLVSEEPVSAHGFLATKPVLDAGNHLSYAFQWLAFAVLGFIGLVWIIRRELQIQRGTTRTRPARRNIDEEAEDTLLDKSLADDDRVAKPN